MTDETSHGGARKGAGRKPLSKIEPSLRKTVVITQSLHDQIAATDGDGNFSRAMRVAAEFYLAHRLDDSNS